MDTSLKQIQASLPAGIKAYWLKGQIWFTVRSSRNGVKTNLGTYLDPNLAKQALAAFKAGITLTVTTSQLKEIASQLQQKELEKEQQHVEQIEQQLSDRNLFELLEEIPFIELHKSMPATHTSEDGTVTIIPSSVVAKFITDKLGLNNKLLSKAYAHRKHRTIAQQASLAESEEDSLNKCESLNVAFFATTATQTESE